jgi:hypothetical protein
VGICEILGTSIQIQLDLWEYFNLEPWVKNLRVFLTGDLCKLVDDPHSWCTLGGNTFKLSSFVNHCWIWFNKCRSGKAPDPNLDRWCRIFLLEDQSSSFCLDLLFQVFHWALSLMLRQWVEMRWHVDFTPSHHQCHRKEGKQQDGVWVSHNLAGFWTPPWSWLFSLPWLPHCSPPHLPSLTTG